MDNADTSSVRDKLPQAKRLTCYFHVIKNVRQRLSKVRSTDQAVYNKIFEDFMTLQASAIDEESFTILYSMFVNKWLREHIFYDPELKQMVANFLEYFNKVMHIILTRKLREFGKELGEN